MKRYNQRRTKIICTLGPSADSKDKIRELISAGANVFRLNFSHGNHEEHGRHISIIRELEKEFGRRFAIIQDLQGPKIRVGELSEPVKLVNGEKVILTTSEVIGKGNTIPVTYSELPSDVKPGDRILMDDGLIELKVISKNQTEVECIITNGGTLSSHKGINLPGVPISIPSLTEKDIEDLKFGVSEGVDYIALSFVRKTADVLHLRELLRKFRGNQGIISKIEKPEALEEIDAIIKASDAVMVARGDLGVEVPIEDVPILQKMIIRKCNEYGRPVITATQMLDSMIREPRPTRAEATDVANAVFDGTDAVMLSGETSAGNFPVESVKIMDMIIRRAEPRLIEYERKLEFKEVRNDFTDSIADAACELSEHLGASIIVSISITGTTARALSKHRPAASIFALTDDINVVRKLTLVWGVEPVEVKYISDTDAMLAQISGILKSNGIASTGDVFVLTAGTPLLARGTTNTLRIERVN
ncbi:MAG: pyruvate kinase [Candidatus Kryptoniota bacterium]